MDIAELEYNKVYYSKTTKKYFFIKEPTGCLSDCEEADYVYMIEGKYGNYPRFFSINDPFNGMTLPGRFYSSQEVRRLSLTEVLDIFYISPESILWSPDRDILVRLECHRNCFFFFEDPFHNEIKLNTDEINRLVPTKVSFRDFYAIESKELKYEFDVEFKNVCIYETCVVGHYKGEDSGAWYPEYEDVYRCKYNISSASNEILEICHGVGYYSKHTYFLNKLYMWLCYNPQLCCDGTPLYVPKKINF